MPLRLSMEGSMNFIQKLVFFIESYYCISKTEAKSTKLRFKLLTGIVLFDSLFKRKLMIIHN